MNITKALALLAVLAITACTANAQKFGHINSAELLEQMPDVKSADTVLSASSAVEQAGRNLRQKVEVFLQDVAV